MITLTFVASPTIYYYHDNVVNSNQKLYIPPCPQVKALNTKYQDNNGHKSYEHNYKQPELT